MKNNIKIMVGSLGLMIAVTSALTACHTVQGAATGMQQDINTLTESKHKVHHKAIKKTSPSSRQGTQTQSNGTQTQQSTTNSTAK